MKRLTAWSMSGLDPYLSCDQCEFNDVDVGCTPIACFKRATGRLAMIEDILGRDYNLDRLRELVEADHDGRCVIFQPGYPIVATYQPKDEDGLYVKNVCGVIADEEYKSASMEG